MHELCIGSLFICEARLASRRKMDQDEEAVQTSGSKTLLVRHLPAELSQDEKEDLLKYFGAQAVRVFPNRGRMVSSDASFSYTVACLHCLTAFSYPQKHAAFATFGSEKSAAKVRYSLVKLSVSLSLFFFF